MKVLVVGNGGRENALVWCLLRSANVDKVFCIPGNGGTQLTLHCVNLPISVDNFLAIAKAVEDNEIDFVVVGPELPLSEGITDYLQAKNIKVFGPTQQGAKIESSKSYAKALMLEGNIPTAKSATFTDLNLAQIYIKEKGVPIVLKADGLAAGKGVIVAKTLSEALTGIETLFFQNFTTVVVEDFLEGQEVSILALTDGITIRSLIPAQDHKQVGEGDRGANTGGMGAYAPTPLIDDHLQAKIDREILQPTLKVLQQRGINYIGVIYAGLIITPDGEIQVLEYNCRFGDPETQAVLAMLQTPLDELLWACINQKLADFPPLEWRKGVAMCVVMASGGYPDSYEKGKVITGIDQAETNGSIVFHAGTKIENDQILTDGGRVLGVTAIGDNVDLAIAKVYQAVSKINFEKMYYRKDIGYRIKNYQK